jgi:hypothetical protein
MAGGYRVDLGWARSAPSIFDRAAGAVVDQRRGPGPLVHGGPSGGGGVLLLIWAVGCDLQLWSHACARRRRQAGTSLEVRQRWLIGARGHGFERGKALREAEATGKVLGWLGGGSGGRGG